MCAPGTSMRGAVLAEVGLRRGYYRRPRKAQREDAIVMSLPTGRGLKWLDRTPAADAAGDGVAAVGARAGAARRSRAAATASEPPVPAVAAAAPRSPAAEVPIAARDAAIAVMPWPALREAVATCTACGLCRSRRQTVFGVGAIQRALDDRREAPGRAGGPEGRAFRRRRRPPAGQHAARFESDARRGTARTAGVHRQHIEVPSARNRNPEAEELARCEPFLVRQIELNPPATDPGDGPLRSAIAAAQQRADRQAARPCAPLPGRAAGRHLPPGLSVAQPGRQVARLGRPVPGGADRRGGRGGAGLTPGISPSWPFSAAASLR